MPAWEDLDAFFQADDFAVTAQITLLNNATRDVVGHFDDPALTARLGDYEHDTVDPTFTCKETDVVGVQRGCTLAIGSDVYDVLSQPETDGTGIAVLVLAPR